MKKKILIVGSSGFLGGFLKKKLSNSFHILLSHKQKKRILDICEYSKLSDYIKKNKIDILINCTGQFSNISKTFTKTTIAGNKNIISLSRKLGFRVVFLSTTSIFDKRNLKYKKMKLKAESLYKKSNIDYKIFQVANVYDSSFKKKGLLRNLKLFFKDDLKKVEVINKSSYRNFIYIEDFCNLVLLILKNWKKFRSKKIVLVTENAKIEDLIAYFKKKYPFKSINLKNLKFKKCKESNIRLNNSLIAKNYFKYKKTTYLSKVIKNL